MSYYCNGCERSVTHCRCPPCNQCNNRAADVLSGSFLCSKCRKEEDGPTARKPGRRTHCSYVDCQSPVHPGRKYCDGCRDREKASSAYTLNIDALHEGHYPPEDIGAEHGELLAELRDVLAAWYDQEEAIQAAATDMVRRGEPLNGIRLRALYAAQDGILERLSPEAMELLVERGERGEIHIGDGICVTWRACPGIRLGGGIYVSRQVWDLAAA